jgi:cellulose synthase/poly-beta-1,6-N-acetylglucosamine synthase-like glycosyltransferase
VSIILPCLLVTIVFLNRYFLGLMLRTAKSRPGVGGAPEPASHLEGLEYPTVCVIIPLYNEGGSIYRTLLSLCDSDYPSDRLSIIVIDDCSTDDSHEWAKRAAALHPDRIEIRRNPRNIGKRLGIAQAVRSTNAEYIVSVDSDVIVTPQAIRLLIAGFDTASTAAVGGRVLVTNARENWLTAMQAVKYWVGYEFLKNLENAFDTVMCLSGCLTAYRRAVLIELEPVLAGRNLLGMPIKYGEDRFLTRQIVRAGYRTKLRLSAECYTKAPSTLTGYFSQQLRWRRSNIVDFLGGITHIWRLNPLVSMHYLALQTLVLSYPIILWQLYVSGSFFGGFLVHLGVLAILALIYGIATRHRPRWQRVHPISFLPIAVILPVTYMVLGLLAVFTLDSGSWETRKHSG